MPAKLRKINPTTKKLLYAFILIIFVQLLQIAINKNLFTGQHDRARADIKYIEDDLGSQTLYTEVDEKFDDMKVKKVNGSGKYKKDNKEEKYYLTDSKKPRIKFKRAEGSIVQYAIIITYSDSSWRKKEERDYITGIENIEVGNTKRTEKHDDYEVVYSRDEIEVKPKSNDMKLKKGNYYFKIRAFDQDREYSDSDQVKVKIGSLEETKRLPSDTSITVERIGSLSYFDKYSLFYYTNPNVTFSGKVAPAAEVDLQLLVNDEKVAEFKSAADGTWSVTHRMAVISNKIEVRTKNEIEEGMYAMRTFNLVIGNLPASANTPASPGPIEPAEPVASTPLSQ